LRSNFQSVEHPRKNQGTLAASPFDFVLHLVLLFLLCLFLGCHWFLFSLPFFMEKSRNDVLLQLLDCIESMKNEVKKKMHVDSRAMLYQSHRCGECQEEKFFSASSKCVSREFPDESERRAVFDSKEIRFCLVQRSGARANARSRMVRDHFRARRIYNGSGEIFAGA